MGQKYAGGNSQTHDYKHEQYLQTNAYKHENGVVADA
jgi:hypothetical protein